MPPNPLNAALAATALTAALTATLSLSLSLSLTPIRRSAAAVGRQQPRAAWHRGMRIYIYTHIYTYVGTYSVLAHYSLASYDALRHARGPEA